MKIVTIAKLMIVCILCLSVGWAGSWFTGSVSNWYYELDKPFFNPPNWVFGPVWTALYILMGIAAFLVWQRGLSERAVRIALIFFAVQLLLNSMWTPLFFGLKSPLIAFVDISLLWLAILLTMIAFNKVSKIAALLLLPYLLWVSFAAILNASIWMLNR